MNNLFIKPSIVFQHFIFKKVQVVTTKMKQFKSEISL